jgi:hypothetical protein
VGRTPHVGNHCSNINSLNLLEKKEVIVRGLKNVRSQSNIISNFLSISKHATSACYSIALLIAKNGKLLSDGPYIKEAIQNCANNLFKDLENREVINKRISELSLSRNTVKDRILKMALNVKEQLIMDLQNCNFFSISLDETTDVTSKARLAILVRFSSGNFMREELLKLGSLTLGTTGKEIFDVVYKTFNDYNIDISKIVSITTDGAPNMVGKNLGFVKLFKDKIGHAIIPFHCIIHQEVLCSKSGFVEFN